MCHRTAIGICRWVCCSKDSLKVALLLLSPSSLLHQKPNITAQEIEDNFDGNICRCTGYRPILDAMKSFAGDANIPGSKTIDIEVQFV